MVDLFPWSMWSVLCGLAVLVVGSGLAIAGGVRWIRRGRVAAGMLLAVGAGAIAVLTGLAQWLSVWIGAAFVRTVLRRWVFLPPVDVPWNPGLGVLLVLTGLGLALVGLAAFRVRLDGGEEA